mgnify:CR=1 FL=1
MALERGHLTLARYSLLPPSPVHPSAPLCTPLSPLYTPLHPYVPLCTPYTPLGPQIIVMVMDQCKDEWEQWDLTGKTAKGNCVTGHLDFDVRRDCTEIALRVLRLR